MYGAVNACWVCQECYRPRNGNVLAHYPSTDNTFYILMFLDLPIYTCVRSVQMEALLTLINHFHFPFYFFFLSGPGTDCCIVFFLFSFPCHCLLACILSPLSDIETHRCEQLLLPLWNSLLQMLMIIPCLNYTSKCSNALSSKHFTSCCQGEECKGVKLVLKNSEQYISPKYHLNSPGGCFSGTWHQIVST